MLVQFDNFNAHIAYSRWIYGGESIEWIEKMLFGSPEIAPV